MKKFVAVIFLFFYFLLSTGFVVSVHYCMDKVDSIAFGDGSCDKCGKCSMLPQDNDGCCKDEVKVVKMQIDQLTAKLVKTDFSILLSSSATPSFLIALSYDNAQLAIPLANGPPLSEQDIYLQNSVFRI